MLSRSPKRQTAIVCGAALGFVLIYEAAVLDSRFVTMRGAKTARPAPGQQAHFAATAYCRGTTTASGAAVRRGVAAADPAFLPVGSVVRIDGIEQQYRGIYTVMDTGPKVRGRHVDLYIWNCDEAVRFGRRLVRLDVLRLGWSPRASAEPGARDLVF